MRHTLASLRLASDCAVYVWSWTLLSQAPTHIPACCWLGQNPIMPVSVMHLFSESPAVTHSRFEAGQPKAIPWTHTTPIRSAANAFFHQDVREGDTVAWPTNLGWMMGPWLVFAALLNGATIALFQGSPLGRDFGVFVQSAGVSMLGLVPSIAKAWRASDCMKVCRMSMTYAQSIQHVTP